MQQTPTSSTLSAPLTAALSATVRVTGVRRGRYVEFDYSVGDRDLSVELIMPFAAFEEFCQRDGVVMLPPADSVALPEKIAGLYRPPV